MISTYLKRYRLIVMFSFLSFYIGCFITIGFLKVDCTSVSNTDSNHQNLVSEKVEYAVLILSGPDNEQKRNTIRATWAKLISNIFIENGEKLYKWNHTWENTDAKLDFVKFYFVIGTHYLNEQRLENLKAENLRTNDLLLLNNFEDSYQSLSKKMILAIKWFYENVKGLKYLIKCDDDSFVRIDLIIQDLEAFAPEMNVPEIRKYVTLKQTILPHKGLYWGYFHGSAKVYLKGKWEEKNWFLCDHYLPYAVGGGYVISRSIVEYISRNADDLSLYKSEDVSMGVWTAALDRVNRVHDNRFDTEWESRGCNQEMIVRHKQTPSEMFQMYRVLVHTQGETLCNSVSKIRKSYMYNWDVLPSMCCKDRH